MKFTIIPLLTLAFSFLISSTDSFAGRACQEATTYEDFCSSCHRLPVTKRECLEAGNFERARLCFDSLGDVISVHGPAIYRACYAAPNADKIMGCASLKYHSQQYYDCLASE